MSPRHVVFTALAIILFSVVALAANDPTESSSTEAVLNNKATFRVLHVNPVVRGTLEAKENHDIKCEVKTGSRGATKIKWVVANGAHVKGPEGLSVTGAVGLGGLDFTRKGNLLVDIDDSYLQEQATDQKIAASKLAEAEEICNVETLLTDRAIKAAEAELESALIQRRKFDGAGALGKVIKNCLLDANVEAAKRSLELEQQEGTERIIEAETNLELAAVAWKIQEDEAADRAEQIRNCKIYAPSTGVVFYHIPEQTRIGAGANQLLLAPGEPVQYGQTLMSIPDLSRLLVNLRIPAQFIGHVKEGLPASVRIEGLPNKTYKAHVKSVDSVASPQDWMSPDVKVYTTCIEIDDAVEGLNYKPDRRAEVTIVTEPADVLAIPLPALIPAKEEGKNPHCLLPTRPDPVEREIEIGVSDGQWVEIKSGLKYGDEVVLHPRKAADKK